MKPLIETDRLILRNISLKDKEDMYSLYSDPDVLKYTGEPLIQTMDEMVKAIQTRIDNYEKYGYGRWATFLKKEMQFVGWAGLAYLPEFDEVDLGYRFLPQYWGLGIATEASRAILKYGFEKLKLEKIIAIAMKENQASIKVMEKVGMELYKLAPYEPGSEDAVWYRYDRKLLTKNES